MKILCNKTVLLLIPAIFVIETARAEYRVYKLGIKYSAAQQIETEVLSNLDHLQYATYHKIAQSQQIRLIDHWMCWGRTSDFKKYCPKPLRPSRAQAQSPNPQATQQPSLTTRPPL
jgi:hypothetical protein